MREKFLSRFETALAEAIDAQTAQFSIADASRLDFTDPTNWYHLIIAKDAGTWEEVKVTAKVGNQITVVRDAANPHAFPAGSLVIASVGAKSLDGFFQTVEVATQADAEAGTSADKLMTPAMVKAAMNWGLPVGSIISWLPGWFGAAGNGGGFNPALGLGVNSVAEANTYLNPRGWYVCDGTAPNLPGSLIWDAPGKYLPNLTDERFLMGGTTVGSAGGSNQLTDHTHAVGTLAVGAAGNHSHTVSTYGCVTDVGLFGGSNIGVHIFGPGTGLYNVQSVTNPGDHTHPLAGSVGSGNAATSTENRPNYLSAFFIIKVF